MPETTIRLTGIDRALRNNSPRVVSKAMVSSLNKTGKAASVAASKVIRRIYTIKKRDLDKKTMRLIRARPGNRIAVIEVIGRPLSLAKFRARQLKKGVKVSILKGKRTLLPHHFITTVTTKREDVTHTGVFKRRGKSRLPIAEPKMVSVPSIFSGDKVMPTIRRTISSRWPRTFNNDLRFFRARQVR